MPRSPPARGGAGPAPPRYGGGPAAPRGQCPGDPPSPRPLPPYSGWALTPLAPGHAHQRVRFLAEATSVTPGTEKLLVTPEKSAPVMTGVPRPLLLVASFVHRFAAAG